MSHPGSPPGTPVAVTAQPAERRAGPSCHDGGSAASCDHRIMASDRKVRCDRVTDAAGRGTVTPYSE
eukprot:9060-Hanusia_phi.AAC.1